MGNVIIKGKGRGVRFHQQFLNRPPELRSRLLRGEEVEINEGDLRHLLKGSYEIVGKAPFSNEPSAEPRESEPGSSNVRADEASDSGEADPSSGGGDEEARSARKPRHRKSRN